LSPVKARTLAKIDRFFETIAQGIDVQGIEDVEPSVFGQVVEHAPGKGAMRAAALQRKADLLLARPINRIVRVHHANQ
jgi:hypothetical protein